MLTHLFYEDPTSYCLTPLFFKFYPTPPFPVVSNPYPPCHIWCIILLNYIMDLNMSSLGLTLVPEGKKDLDVFYVTRHKVYWGLTHNVFFLAVLWFDITHIQTHKHRHTAHSQSSRLTHPYKFIFTLPVMCSQELSLLHWMNNSLNHYYKKITFHNVFSFQKLFICKSQYMLIRWSKAMFFLWNTNNTDRNGANKQNTYTHTKHSEKEVS